MKMVVGVEIQEIFSCKNSVLLELQKTLRPCPFCGGVAKFFAKRNLETDMTYLFLECEGCGCKSNDYFVGGGIILNMEPSPINLYPNGDPLAHITLARRWDRRVDD